MIALIGTHDVEAPARSLGIAGQIGKILLSGLPGTYQ